MKVFYFSLFLNLVAASSVGIARNDLEHSELSDMINKLFYLNVTVYQDHLGDENYTLILNLIPVDGDYDKKVLPVELADSEKAVQSDDIVPDRTTTPPPGGLLGSIESFLKVIPSFPGAAVETVTHLVSGVPELLGINVTHIWNTTLVGFRKNPIGTSVTAINNVAFCNPLFAGVNAGRCKGFFMAT